VRESVEVFVAAVTVTVPLPLPVEPLFIVSQAAALVATHEQPVGAVTVTDIGPPAAGSEIDVGETVYEHVAPASVTVIV
jgi:hypothetical protein